MVAIIPSPINFLMTSPAFTPISRARSPTLITSEILITLLLARGTVISVFRCSFPGRARFFLDWRAFFGNLRAVRRSRRFRFSGLKRSRCFLRFRLRYERLLPGGFDFRRALRRNFFDRCPGYLWSLDGGLRLRHRRFTNFGLGPLFFGLRNFYSTR